MSLAVAVTPNVKGIIICDGISGSDVERNVFTAENIRQRATIPRFDPLHLFLQLDCARKGADTGEVRLSCELDLILARTFTVNFEEDGGAYEGVYVTELDPSLAFPEPGRYTFQVFFHFPGSSAILKGERSFDVSEEEP
jgi:hypothetical protein